MHLTPQELPYSVQLPVQVLQIFQHQKLERFVGGKSGKFLRLTFFLIYPVNFHCYSFLGIKSMGEKGSIILKHN